MKTAQQLEAIRRKNWSLINLRKAEVGEDIRVVVGMATCGIAAGAKEVFEALQQEIERRGLRHVRLVPTGCIGMCRLEPMVEVYSPSGGRTTYVQMTPQKVRMIVADHLANGHPVREFTVAQAPESEEA